MIKDIFFKTVYVKVYENRFVLKLLEQGQKPVTVIPTEAFTTSRLLVGEFTPAHHALKKGFKDLFKGKWFAASPVLVMHPMEKIEGGLSEIEERIFQELAAGTGARKVVLWTGHELSDAEAAERANST